MKPMKLFSRVLIHRRSVEAVFGSSALAVFLGNVSGATIYQQASVANRVERFEQGDNGTPSERDDDTYHFLSAWGIGVEAGSAEFQICICCAANQRIDTFELVGTAPPSFGSSRFHAAVGGWSQPTQVAVDPQGIVYAPDLVAAARHKGGHTQRRSHR